MPGGNGMGPEGKGPGTGWGTGFCFDNASSRPVGFGGRGRRNSGLTWNTEMGQGFQRRWNRAGNDLGRPRWGRNMILQSENLEDTNPQLNPDIDDMNTSRSWIQESIKKYFDEIIQGIHNRLDTLETDKH